MDCLGGGATATAGCSSTSKTVMALEAWTTAIGKAADLADAAFGQTCQPPGGSN